MKSNQIKEIEAILSTGDPVVVTIDPDVKTEISRKKIDGIVVDMKRHLAKNKKVHILVIKE